jgi:hypothetical protein
MPVIADEPRYGYRGRTGTWCRRSPADADENRTTVRRHGGPGYKSAGRGPDDRVSVELATCAAVGARGRAELNVGALASQRLRPKRSRCEVRPDRGRLARLGAAVGGAMMR